MGHNVHTKISSMKRIMELQKLQLIVQKSAMLLSKNSKRIIRSIFTIARDNSNVGVIILTGEGEKAFCSGGDQKVRGHGGYVGEDEIPRLNVLDLQRLIRVIPKPVVAMVAGFAIGGGHVLHVVCDLTIAADNAIFGQTGPKVGCI